MSIPGRRLLERVYCWIIFASHHQKKVRLRSADRLGHDDEDVRLAIDGHDIRAQAVWRHACCHARRLAETAGFLPGWKQERSRLPFFDRKLPLPDGLS